MTGAPARDAGLRGRGNGKVILLGEHAAVYGHAAIAGAIDRGVDAVAVRRPGPLALRATGTFTLEVSRDDAHPVATALAILGDALGLTDGIALEATSTLPAGAGLGSSAALAVALTRALAAAIGRALDDDAVAELANRAERAFHGNPSGLDAAVAAHGGLVRFARGAALTPVHGAALPLVIGLSGQPRSTAAMVAKVAAARDADASADLHLAQLGALADAAVAQLAEGAAAWPRLGAAMDEAHGRLAALGVSTPRLCAMVAAARDAGALGAKLTGGGGGGAVIALAPGREDAVLAAWRGLDATSFVTTLGGSA